MPSACFTFQARINSVYTWLNCRSNEYPVLISFKFQTQSRSLICSNLPPRINVHRNQTVIAFNHFTASQNWADTLGGPSLCEILN